MHYMGQLYKKSVFGKKILAYFENGQVHDERNAGKVLAYYDNRGYIYKDLDTAVVATCDINGNIYRGKGVQGAVLAKCEDGKIYKDGKRLKKVLAWYDGDMYGAAAALAVLELNNMYD